MRLKLRSIVLATLLPWGSTMALAQTEADLVDAFSGDWYTFDPAFSESATPCKLGFDSEIADVQDQAGRSVEVDDTCVDLFANQTLSWRIVDGKILLQGSDGDMLAELGGNPDKLSGDLNGPIDALILERREGSDFKQVLVSALSEHKCYYLGYSSDCADETAVNAPATETGATDIDVLVDLNVRGQPRRNAPVVGVVPRDSTISVNLCLRASDGVWCRANFGDVDGWMSKSVIRDAEWPVITFVSAE